MRQALAEQRFGVLSEIDVRATLREKRGLQMEDYLILGACNPDLAHRAAGRAGSRFAAAAQRGGQRFGRPRNGADLNPQIMASLTGIEELRPIAEEATRRLQAVMDNLSGAQERTYGGYAGPMQAGRQATAADRRRSSQAARPPTGRGAWIGGTLLDAYRGKVAEYH